jgi:hypothetical protein
MGRRSEPRIAISFPVLACGFDLGGSAFAASAKTYDISRSGASLTGLQGLVEPGKKIEIEFKDQKAWYRVQWVGKNGSAKSGRIGVHCLERKYIWDVAPKAVEADAYNETAQPAGTDASAALPRIAGERRFFQRRACRIETEVWIPGSSVRLPGRVTDISLSGCYVDILAPLPIDTMVELGLTAGDTTLRISGKVRSSHLGLGMGVAFMRMSPGDFEKLRKLAPPGPSSLDVSKGASDSNSMAQPQFEPHPGPLVTQGARSTSAPASSMSAKHPPTTAEALEAVVRVLLRKGLLAPGELAEELERMKTVKN